MSSDGASADVVSAVGSPSTGVTTRFSSSTASTLVMVETTASSDKRMRRTPWVARPV